MEPISSFWAGVKIGGTTGIAMLATSSALEDASVSLVVVVPCTVFICGCVWWLGKRFQRIDDRLEYLHRRMDGLPCAYEDWPCGKDKKHK